MRCCWALLVVPLLSAQDAANTGVRNQELSQLLTRGDQTKVMGDAAGAVKLYEEALAQVKAGPVLAPREEEVLQHLTSGYIAAQRPADAVTISRRILQMHSADCEPGAPAVERCADSQYGLGVSLMHAGDFPAAVTELTASVSNFAKVNQQGDETLRMTKQKQTGDAESMLAAALFRSGQKEKSIAMFRKAISTLQVVAGDEKLNPGTRGSAQKSLSDAQASLKMLEGK